MMADFSVLVEDTADFSVLVEDTKSLRVSVSFDLVAEATVVSPFPCEARLTLTILRVMSMLRFWLLLESAWR